MIARAAAAIPCSAPPSNARGRVPMLDMVPWSKAYHPRTRFIGALGATTYLAGSDVRSVPVSAAFVVYSNDAFNAEPWWRDEAVRVLESIVARSGLPVARRVVLVDLVEFPSEERMTAYVNDTGAGGVFVRAPAPAPPIDLIA